MRSCYDPELLEHVLPLITVAQPALLQSGTYYVAESPNGEAIGCGGWTRERPGSSEIKGGVGHIRHFAVHPDWTRLGVGKMLYSRCVLDARDAGLSQFECYSSLNGEVFYAALGFRKVADVNINISDAVSIPSVRMIAEI
jgi:N-acetylglutamate synthase-like GNAT family acetyltransferase